MPLLFQQFKEKLRTDTVKTATEDKKHTLYVYQFPSTLPTPTSENDYNRHERPTCDYVVCTRQINVSTTLSWASFQESVPEYTVNVSRIETGAFKKRTSIAITDVKSPSTRLAENLRHISRNKMKLDDKNSEIIRKSRYLDKNMLAFNLDNEEISELSSEEETTEETRLKIFKRKFKAMKVQRNYVTALRSKPQLYGLLRYTLPSENDDEQNNGNDSDTFLSNASPNASQHDVLLILRPIGLDRSRIDLKTTTNFDECCVNLTSKRGFMFNADNFILKISGSQRPTGFAGEDQKAILDLKNLCRPCFSITQGSFLELSSLIEFKVGKLVNNYDQRCFFLSNYPLTDFLTTLKLIYWHEFPQETKVHCKIKSVRSDEGFPEESERGLIVFGDENINLKPRPHETPAEKGKRYEREMLIYTGLRGDEDLELFNAAMEDEVDDDNSTNENPEEEYSISRFLIPKKSGKLDYAVLLVLKPRSLSTRKFLWLAQRCKLIYRNNCKISCQELALE